MPKPLTFLDSNVLIGAWVANRSYSVKALALVDDPNREFVSSPFVRLETNAQAAYHRKKPELQFYETHFNSVRIWVDQYAQMVKRALDVSMSASSSESPA